MGPPAEQHQALVDNLSRKKRGQILHIVWRADCVHVDRDDVETDKATEDQAARLPVDDQRGKRGSAAGIDAHEVSILKITRGRNRR